MTLYFDNNLPDVPGLIEEIIFSPNHPLVACRSYSGSTGQGVISIFNTDSELVDTEVQSQKSTQIQWHPSKPILATAWTSGRISLWNGENKERQNEDNLSSEQIEHLVWSQPNGKRLITGDINGNVKAWRANGKAQLQQKPAWEYAIDGGIGSILCRQQEGASSDLAKMAVAAVSSGEDLMRPGFESTQSVENLGFYIASQTSGDVVYVNAKGQKKNVVSVPNSTGIKKLTYCPYRAILVVVCGDLALHAYRSALDGVLQEMRHVKLSGEIISTAWVAPAVLISATGDGTLKIWDMQHNEHQLIQPDDSITNARITHVQVNTKTATIAAAANEAGVLFWSFSRSRQSGSLVFNQKKTSLTRAVKLVTWFQKSTLSPLLACANDDQGALLREQQIQEASHDDLTVVQTGPNSVRIHLTNGDSFDTEVDVPIHALSVRAKPTNQIAVWSGKTVFTYEISSSGQLECISSSITSATPHISINGGNIYTFSEELDRLRVHSSREAIEKQVMHLAAAGTELDTNGQYLACSCHPSHIRVYELIRREARQLVNRDVSTLLPDVTFIHEVRVNSSGNSVAFLATDQSGNEDGRVYIYSPERQKIQIHDTRHVLSRLSDNDGTLSSTSFPRGSSASPHLSDVADSGSIQPVMLKWDERDPNLLCVHYSGENEEILVCYWVTESGLVEQEELSFPSQVRSFLSLRAPNFIFSTNDGDVQQVALRDFVGIESCDDVTRQALLDFSRQMAIGDLDGAFNSIKLIKNERVWLNLAKRCVYTKRLDVAKVCLANMGNARAAAALRKAQKEPELDAQVAMLALQLGMVPEAEKLYKQAKRFDLLNKFYQSIGRWDEALEIANKHDRLHLRATHYQYAKKLEWEKSYTEAVKHYEHSKTNVFEVPRMLFDDPQALYDYVSNNQDPALRKWWAQYQEFCGEFEQAEKYYQQCQDYLSLVRVFCCLERIDEADKMANETGDYAACYHMARHHESGGNIKQAIHFFTRAQAYNNVIRICKEHGFEDQLLNVALLAQPSDMLEAAIYFQQREDTIDKAVLLFHRAGNLAKAIELVFTHRRFGALENLVEELDRDTDVNVLSRCADFFLENNRHAKAAHLFLLSKDYVKALKMIVDFDVELTSGMIQLFILPDNVPQRSKIMEAVAQHCYDRTQFQEAAQLYQHAGLRQDAMKCLARLGDTQKMIEFAQLARDPNLFVLAANYLRSALSWQTEPTILKAIVTFYRKAKKFSALAAFFVECSNHTIDTTGDYGRGIGLLGEALKQLGATRQDTRDLEEMIRSRAMMIKDYLDLKDRFVQSPNSAINNIQQMYSDTQNDDSHPIRKSDLAGMCVEFYSQSDPQRALDYAKTIQRMQQGPFSDFVSPQAIARLRAANEKDNPVQPSDSGTSINSGEIAENIRY